MGEYQKEKNPLKQGLKPAAPIIAPTGLKLGTKNQVFQDKIKKLVSQIERGLQ